MFFKILLFLPAATCLFWIVLHCMTISRTETLRSLVSLLIISGIYFFVDACYSSLVDAPLRMLMISAILVQASIPSLIPLAWHYLHRLRAGSEPFHAARYVWAVFPIMLFSTVLLLTLLIGPDQIETFIHEFYARGDTPAPGPEDGLMYYYYIITVIGIRVVIIGEALVYTAAMAVLRRQENIRLRHLHRFFAGERIRVVELQFFLIVLVYFALLFKIFTLFVLVIDRAWVQALLALVFSSLVFLFCYVALFGARGEVSLREMANSFMFNYGPECKEAILEEEIGTLVESAREETLLRIRERYGHRFVKEEETPPGPAVGFDHSLADEIFSAVAGSWQEDVLLHRFRNLMLEEKAFLEPGLSLGDVAERIHSNKTYVSRMVNNIFEAGFPDLINTLRVDYAGHYLVEHREAKQAEVAAACGFTSASTFNNTFKKVTGMTPKIWLAAYDQQRARETGKAE